MLNQERCAVCESVLNDFGAPGDVQQYDCPRCGQFEISRTACAVLRGRLVDDPKAGVRLSHAIRRRSDAEPWFSVGSGNLGRLIAERLPDHLSQRASILLWLQAGLRESEGEAVLVDETALLAIIGAANHDVVQQHVDELSADGLLRIEKEQRGSSVMRWSLTSAGWREADRTRLAAEANLEEYDLFISHASEDKAGFVDALVAELKNLGLQVWYDAAVIRLGDSLRRSIDRGLARSRFGVVVLSPAFFEKEWPQRELDGLAALEIAGKPRILPLWHGLTQAAVAQYSPTLADRLALSTANGSKAVAAQLADRLKLVD